MIGREGSARSDGGRWDFDGRPRGPKRMGADTEGAVRRSERGWCQLAEAGSHRV